MAKESPSEELQGGTNRTVLAFVVFGFFVVITLIAWFFSVSFVEEQTKDQFTLETQQITNAIASRLDIYLNALSGTRGLFEASNFVDRSEFRKYISSLNIQTEYPGIQGIGYTVFVTPEELEEHIQTIRDEGFPDYTIKPSGERDIYTSIIYLEPFDVRNQQAFGFDMYQEINRNTAMNMARDTNSIAMSNKVTLVQEIDDDVQAGFLVYIPVFEKGVSTLTLEERREAVMGYVYSVFRVGDLMSAILSQRSLNFDVEVFDADSVDDITSENRIFSSFGALNDPVLDTGRLELFTPIERAGQTWIVRYVASSEFGTNFLDKSIGIFVIVGGLFVGTVAAYLVYILLNSRKKAVEFARELNTDLLKSKKSLEEANRVTKEKLQELERLNAAMVDREVKMSELKKELGRNSES